VLVRCPRLQHALCFEDAVEFRHREDAHVTGRPHGRFRVEPDRQSGDFEHRQVVGPVADCDGVPHLDAHRLGEVSERVVFRPFDERPLHLASQFTVRDGEAVGDDGVDGDTGFLQRAFDAALEAAGEDCRVMARLVEVVDDLRGVRSEDDFVEGRFGLLL